MAKLQVISYSIVWYIISILDSFFNKMFYVDYPYPITISLAHMTINVLLFYLVSLWRGLHYKILDFTIIKYTCCLGFLKLMVSIFSHTSVLMLTLAYSQTIKTLSPMLIIILSKLFYHKGEPMHVYISILLMSAGVTLCTSTEYSLNVVGVVACITMVGCNSLFSFLSKHYLSKFKIDAFSLALDIHLIAFVLVVPIWIITELPSILSNSKLANLDNQIFFVKMFFIQGLTSFGCHFLKFLLLALLPSISYTMIDAGKCIFTIIFSMIMYNHYHSFFNTVGVVIAVSGAIFYHTINEIGLTKRD